jgi:hypothetical protein
MAAARTLPRGQQRSRRSALGDRVALADAGEPKRLHVYDIAHYDIYEHPHVNRAISDVVAFLAEHEVGPA